MRCVLSCFRSVWLCDSVGCSHGSSDGLLLARTLERVAMASSRGALQLRDSTPVSYVSCTCRWILYHQRHLWIRVPSDITCHLPILQKYWFLHYQICDWVSDKWMMIRWLEMTDHTYSPIRSTVVTVWVDVGRSSRREPPGNLPGSGGHSDPVPYPCLGNPTDRGAWWATVHGLAESDTTQWLSTQRGSKSYSQGRNGVKGRQTSALVSITFCCSITISE